jgi:hypothetical protein
MAQHHALDLGASWHAFGAYRCTLAATARHEWTFHAAPPVDDIDLDKYLPPMRYPYGTACAVKIRLISLILGMQYRYMPQATTASCRLSQLFKVLRECRNWMPRELVFGDSWSRTLRFP